MRTAALGVLACGVAARLLQSASVLACGASAPPFYVVKEQAPTSAAAPLNTPLIVTLIEDADGPVVESFNPTLTLTRGRADIGIELKALGAPPTLVWVPVEPLAPGTLYVAHFNPGYEGIPDSTWSFTTGTESTPPLSLEGELEVTLESAVEFVPTSPCIPGCGNAGDCAGAGTSEFVNVTKARVKIPRAVDGFAQRTGAVWLTDDKPYDFSPISKTGPLPYEGTNVSILSFADLDDPSVTEVLITLPEEQTPYEPCFAFAASDARGDRAISKPLCLDRPIMPVANEGDAVSDPATPDGLANDIQKPGTSKGCNVGRPASGNGTWLGLVVPLAMIRGRRRRRPIAECVAVRGI